MGSANELLRGGGSCRGDGVRSGSDVWLLSGSYICLSYIQRDEGHDWWLQECIGHWINREAYQVCGLDYNQPLCLTSVNAWKVVSRSVHIFYFQSRSFLFHEYAQEYSCGVWFYFFGSSTSVLLFANALGQSLDANLRATNTIVRSNCRRFWFTEASFWERALHCMLLLFWQEWRKLCGRFCHSVFRDWGYNTSTHPRKWPVLSRFYNQCYSLNSYILLYSVLQAHFSVLCP